VPILPQNFYNRSSLLVAQDLLGCFLVRKFSSDNHLSLAKGEVEKGLIKFKIVETEAYEGPNDLASHASRGRTPRNEPMFGPPGMTYVYFTYGMHYLLNIVTGKKNYPAAILIRAVESIPFSKDIITSKLPTNGPAKLTKFLQINKALNNIPVYTKKHGLWIENRVEKIKPSQIVKATRVGIDYADIYKNKKWRFYLKNNFFVSKK
jgi:DNA-3-methyladenine glycosylase